MAKLYTMEKVLYLASRELGINVDKSERKDTDLSIRINKLLSNDDIEKVAKDDVSNYYKITKKGKINLLKLQISWRKQNGKDTDVHESELSELLASK